MVRWYVTLVFVVTCAIAVGFGAAVLIGIWSNSDVGVGPNLLMTASLLFVISRVVMGMSRARRGK